MSENNSNESSNTDSKREETAYLHARNTPHVWKQTNEKEAITLIKETGEIDPTIQQATERIDKEINQLWQFLAPVTIAGAEIKKNTKLYHTEYEYHLQAEEIRITQDGVPTITFRKVDSTPTKYVVLDGVNIRELRNHDTTCKLRTQEEIHDNITKTLGMNTS